MLARELRLTNLPSRREDLAFDLLFSPEFDVAEVGEQASDLSDLDRIFDSTKFLKCFSLVTSRVVGLVS